MPDHEFQPDWFSKPGDTIAALMAERHLERKDLARQLEVDLDTFRGILIGIVAIDHQLAAKLAACLGGSEHFWRNRQREYEVSLDRIAKTIPPAQADKWLKEIATKLTGEHRRHKRDADIKWYLAYFGVSSPAEWEEKYTKFKGDTAFRTTTAFSSPVGPLTIWLRQAEMDAAALPTSAWKSDSLRDSLPILRKLTNLRRPSDFIPKIRTICSRAGVAVSFVRAPSGCRASGAAKFLSADKAMVALSFRHLSDDHFWFTFFHELGHLLLHGKETTFVDEEEGSENEREREANLFASGALIPPNRHEEFSSLRSNMQSIVRFSVSIGLAPGVVVGQLQHEGIIAPEKMNFLKRRYSWADIDEVVG